MPTDSQDSEFNALPEVVRTVVGRPYNDVASFKTTQIQGGITNRLYSLEPVAFESTEEEFWSTIEIPKTIDMLNPLLYAVAVQLIAYYTAVSKGTDVDQPRNLAKSVTVE